MKDEKYLTISHQIIGNCIQINVVITSQTIVIQIYKKKQHILKK